MKRVCTEFKKLRAALGVSQGDCARRLEVSRALVCAIERGSRTARPSLLARMRELCAESDAFKAARAVERVRDLAAREAEGEFVRSLGRRAVLAYVPQAVLSAAWHELRIAMEDLGPGTPSRLVSELMKSGVGAADAQDHVMAKLIGEWAAAGVRSEPEATPRGHRENREPRRAG